MRILPYPHGAKHVDHDAPHPVPTLPGQIATPEPVPGLATIRAGIDTGAHSAAAVAESLTGVPGLAARILRLLEIPTAAPRVEPHTPTPTPAPTPAPQPTPTARSGDRPSPLARLSVPAAELRRGDWLHTNTERGWLWLHILAVHTGSTGVAVALSGAEAVLLPLGADVEIERPTVPTQRTSVGGGDRG
jgi:hypothetical protein